MLCTIWTAVRPGEGRRVPNGARRIGIPRSVAEEVAGVAGAGVAVSRADELTGSLGTGRDAVVDLMSPLEGLEGGAYRVRGWLAVQSDLAVGINRALGEAGIQIPFPQRDLHVRNVPELREAVTDAMQAAQRKEKQSDE